jgi:hypothetical protein
MTYQTDTVDVKDLYKDLINIQGTGALRIDRVAPLSLDSLPVRDMREQIDTAGQTRQSSQPTFAQIRYWRWQREQKLLIGDSRYIKPKSEVHMVKSVTPYNYGFGLPSREINSAATDWLTAILMLILVLFASVRNSYSRYLGNLFKSVINYSTAFRMFKEKNYPLLHGAYRLEIFFYIIFSVFLLQIVSYFPIELNKSDSSLFFICLGITLAYFLIKKLAYKLTGVITETCNETNEYLFNMDSIKRVAGLILFPLVIIGIFFPYSHPGVIVFTGLFIISALYLRLLQRGILILFKKQFSIFYLFLYFCTLEFVPLVLLYNILEL